MAFGVSTKVDETNQVVVMAKRLFQQELSFKSIPLYAFVFMFPRLSHALNIRVNGNVSDFFMKFSMEIIKQKREEFRKNKENKLKADNFIELLLEAERENEKQSNETDKNNKQTAKCKFFVLLMVFLSFLYIFFHFHSCVKRRNYCEFSSFLFSRL